MTELEKELETYKKLLPSLIEDQGKFVVIQKDSLIGTYTSYEDALKVGYQQCGMTPFLVKRISSEENISYFSRDLNNKCHV